MAVTKDCKRKLFASKEREIELQKTQALMTDEIAEVTAREKGLQDAKTAMKNMLVKANTREKVLQDTKTKMENQIAEAAAREKRLQDAKNEMENQIAKIRQLEWIVEAYRSHQASTNKNLKNLQDSTWWRLGSGYVFPLAGLVKKKRQ